MCGTAACAADPPGKLLAAGVRWEACWSRILRDTGEKIALDIVMRAFITGFHAVEQHILEVGLTLTHLAPFVAVFVLVLTSLRR